LPNLFKYLLPFGRLYSRDISTTLATGKEVQFTRHYLLHHRDEEKEYDEVYPSIKDRDQCVQKVTRNRWAAYDDDDTDDEHD
jgi:hypothetical protein